jgi:two-component system sensor histidine kinase KdpD
VQNHVRADEIRPSPEDLLKIANAAERQLVHGRLIINLGYAAGVGKTYTMLADGLQMKREGVDVVIGYAETHGRVETDALVARLEAVPRVAIQYQGLQLREMNIDGIIERKPTVVLVDELAHTNAPGSRHLKRYQDIEEILRAGISVYTTVNIQHVESLNDAVAQITGIRVSETVPDTFFDIADDIRMIDLPPEELQARLKCGKVYVQDMAAQAIENFFATANLLALRQLALRFVATRTDQQMVSHMRARAIPGPWPAVERLLVAVRASPHAEKMVRAAYRASLQRNAEWIVLSIEEESAVNLTDQEWTWLNQAMETARRLGGRIVRYRGENVASEIVRYARKNNVTTIMLGKPRGIDILISPVYRIMRQTPGIDIILFDARGAPRIPLERQIPRLLPRDFLITVVLILSVTFLNYFLRGFISPTNLLIIQLLPVVVSAWFFGRGASVFAAFVSVVTFDFIFVEPYYTFRISDWEYFITFIGYIAIALVISHLTSRLRYLIPQIRRSEATVAAVAGLSKDLADRQTREEILEALASHMRAFARGTIAVLIPDDGGLRIGVADPSYTISAKEMVIARWAFDNGQSAGAGTDTLPTSAGLYVPMKAHGRVFGIMAFIFSDTGSALTPENSEVIEAMAQLGALALERVSTPGPG